jgi:peptidoglycan/LPS O-acetylase OafA/YrhL
MNVTIIPDYPEIESLRGIAALWVVILHIDWTFLFIKTPLIRNGYLMVDFFFILSGFVITINYAHKIKYVKDLRNFMILRLFRLYPLHLCTLLFFAISYLLITTIKTGSVAFFLDNFSLPFLYNLFLVHYIGIFKDANVFNAPSWSISVEFYVYLVFAIQCLLAKRVSMLFNLIIVALGLTFLIINHNSLESGNIYHGIIRCLLGFNIGCLMVGFKFETFKNKYAVYVNMLILLGFLSVKEPNTSYDLFVYPLFILLIFTSITTTSKLFKDFINHPLLVKLGLLSYSIYMVHYPIMYCIKIGLARLKYPLVQMPYGKIFEVGGLKAYIMILVYLAFVFILSHFTFKYIENPFRIRGKKMVKKLN